MNAPTPAPIDHAAVSAFVQRLDPATTRERARAILRRTEERTAASLLPPDARPTPPPKR